MAFGQHSSPRCGPARLDPGERAAIALAISVDADAILIDDRADVAAARSRRLQAVGMLGLLQRAARRELLDLPGALARLGARRRGRRASASAATPRGRRLSPVAWCAYGARTRHHERSAGLVGAETFAAVHPRDNAKLAADLTKLAGRPETHRSVFFLSPRFPGAVRRPHLERAGVQVRSIDV